MLKSSSFHRLQLTPANSSSSQVRSDPINSNKTFLTVLIRSSKTQVRFVPIKTFLTNLNLTPHTDQSQLEPCKLKPKPNKHAIISYRSKLTNPKPTIMPQLISIKTYKPKPNKCYSYPQRRREDSYPPVLILMANQW